MNRFRGFTLIEMALVLMVIGLVARFGISVVSRIQDTMRTDITNQRMAVIEKALQLYVVRNGCLPCPADGSQASRVESDPFGSDTYSLAGLADGGGAYLTGCATDVCRSADRTVPWITLGLSEQDITDGWGNRMRYVVSGNQNCGGTPPLPTLSEDNGIIRCSASVFPLGDIQVNDNSGGAATTEVAYVLISSGPDQSLALKAGSGTLTGDRYNQRSGGGGQDLNAADDTGGTPTFAKGQINSTNSTAHFDDIVRFKTAPLIVLQCGANACGNPA